MPAGGRGGPRKRYLCNFFALGLCDAINHLSFSTQSTMKRAAASGSDGFISLYIKPFVNTNDCARMRAWLVRIIASCARSQHSKNLRARTF